MQRDVLYARCHPHREMHWHPWPAQTRRNAVRPALFDNATRSGLSSDAFAVQEDLVGCSTPVNDDIRVKVLGFHGNLVTLVQWSTSMVTDWGLNQYYHRQSTTLKDKKVNGLYGYEKLKAFLLKLLSGSKVSRKREKIWKGCHLCHSLGQRQAKVIEELGKLVAFCTRVLNVQPWGPCWVCRWLNGWTVSSYSTSRSLKSHVTLSPFSLSGGILGHGFWKLNLNTAFSTASQTRDAVLCSVVHAYRCFRKCLAKLCGGPHSPVDRSDRSLPKSIVKAMSCTVRRSSCQLVEIHENGIGWL